MQKHKWEDHRWRYYATPEEWYQEIQDLASELLEVTKSRDDYKLSFETVTNQNRVSVLRYKQAEERIAELEHELSKAYYH